MIYDTDLLEVEKDVDVDAGGGEEAGRHTKLSFSEFNAWKKKTFLKAENIYIWPLYSLIIIC